MVNKYIKSSVVLGWMVFALFTILVGLGGWNLIKVASVPETYATQKYVDTQNKKVSDQICSLKNDLRDDAKAQKTAMSKQIDELKKDFNNKILGIHNRINSIDRHMEKIQDLIIKHMTNSNSKRTNNTNRTDE